MLRVPFVAAVLSLCCIPNPAKTAPIWSDGFESGTLSAWSGSSGNWAVVTSTLSAHTGLRGADVKGNTAPDEDIISVTAPSLGFESIEFSYWYKVRDSLDPDDYVSAEWTANGTDWRELAKYSDAAIGDWQYANFLLPAEASDNPNLGFRFRAGLSSSTDRMNFDDVVVVGQSVPEPGALSILAGAGLLLRRRRR